MPLALQSDAFALPARGGPSTHARNAAFVATCDKAASSSLAEASSPAPGRTASSEVALLRREVERLRDEVSDLAEASGVRRELAELRSQIAAMQEGRAAAQQLVPAAAEQAERDRELEMQAVETRFQEEAIDAVWSEGASAAVLEALEDPETDALEIRSLDCRSKTCRVEIAEDESSDSAGMLPTFLMRLNEALPRTVASRIELADGSASTVLFLSAKSVADQPQGGESESGPRGGLHQRRGPHIDGGYAA